MEPSNKDGKIVLDHLGIAVPSLAEAVKLYEDILGLKVSGYEVIPEEKTRVAMLPVGDSRIELMEPLETSESSETRERKEPKEPNKPQEPNSPIARFLAKHGPGLHHICLRVPDLAAAVARLQQNGVKLVNPEPGVGAGGHRYVFVHPSSAGGVLLELVQAP